MCLRRIRITLRSVTPPGVHGYNVRPTTRRPTVKKFRPSYIRTRSLVRNAPEPPSSHSQSKVELYRSRVQSFRNEDRIDPLKPYHAYLVAHARPPHPLTEVVKKATSRLLPAGEQNRQRDSGQGQLACVLPALGQPRSILLHTRRN